MITSYRFQLLASPHNHPGNAFSGPTINAIKPWEVDGGYPMPGDELSWHFLLTDDEDNLIGCVRYLVHPRAISFNKLLIAHSFMASNADGQDKVQEAVEADLKLAHEQQLSYIEIDGWALEEEWRGTSAALHSSSSILRRTGGASFQVRGEVIPPYEDPGYGCQMDLLRFDSRLPARRFIPLISQVEKNWQRPWRLCAATTRTLRTLSSNSRRAFGSAVPCNFPHSFTSSFGLAVFEEPIAY
jgi:hypothetical protein